MNISQVAFLASTPEYTPGPTTSINAASSLLLHFPRATSDASSSSPTTSTADPTTTRPFFSDPSSVTPTPKPKDEKSVVAKSVLEYVILAVGVVIIGFIFIQRYTRLRRNNEPLNRFFSLGPRPGQSNTSIRTPFPRTTALSSVPPYPYSQRTRAQDIDAAGRRIGGDLQISDHDGLVGDKDALPAYDNSGGPPKYGELEMMPTSGRTPVSGPEPEPEVGVNMGRISLNTSRVGSPPVLLSPSNNSATPNTERDVERGESISAPPAARLR